MHFNISVFSLLIVTLNICCSCILNTYNMMIFFVISLPQCQTLLDDINRIFSSGVEQQKQATRKYSRKQVKWIRGRFLKSMQVKKSDLSILTDRLFYWLTDENKQW